MAIDDYWFKNAVIYCLNVATYMDFNGDGIGDFEGLSRRFGTSGDFVELTNHAQALGMRVIVDLVANHTSDQHSWFRSARADPKSPFRDWYVWSDKRPRGHATGTVFPPVQETTWTRDSKARKYYFHRFYEFQPDH